MSNQLTKSQEEKVKKLLDNFDFAYCLEANKHLRWHMSFTSVAEMRFYANELITNCLENGEDLVRCGGFLVMVDKKLDNVSLLYYVYMENSNEEIT